MVEDREVSSPPVIGLMGGIGSGKSTVAEILASLGCVVSNADELARDELGSPEVVGELRDHWGPDVIQENEQPNRGAIAAIVFNDDMERAWLERILHPRVVERRKQQFANAPTDVPAYVIDAPLLLETDTAKECDHLLFVDVPREIRLERVAKSRDWNDEELARREKAQSGLEEKKAQAGFVINNDSDFEELRRRVAEVLKVIEETP